MQTIVGLNPLTVLQHSMVLAALRQPNAGLYLVQEVCATSDQLDFESLRSAYQCVVNRHTALRTRFVREGHRMWQRVEEVADIHWEQANSESCDEFLRQDRHRGFDFDHETPERFTVLETSAGAVHLIWTIHHSLVDGASFIILWRELFAIYEAHLRGERCSLPSSPPFHDHLDHLEKLDHRDAEVFWKQCFKGIGPTTGFIVDRLLPALKNPNQPGEERFRRERIEIPEDLGPNLVQFAHQNGIKVHTLIQGAWALLLGRYSGRNEVVFGVLRSGRRSAQARPGDMVGPLANTLPFPVSMPRDMVVGEWLKSIRERWLALGSYEHAPLSGVPGSTAPFDTLIAFSRELAGDTLQRLGGNWERRQVTVHRRTDVPLTLVATEQPRLSADLCFDAELFSRETMSRLAVHFSALLKSFIDQPGARLGELRMLPEREEAWLIRELNQTNAPYSADDCAHQAFENHARRAPERTALEHGDVRTSYGELERQANRQAAWLRAKGVGPEDVIGVSMARSPALIVCVLAVLKAGSAFLPLDPLLPPDRLAGMIRDARAKFVLSGDAEFDTLVSCGERLLNVDRLNGEIEAFPDKPFPCPAAPENAAYAIYTSGSTGKPKAVVVTHRSLVNYVTAARARLEINEGDRRLQFASVGSDMFIAEVFNFLSSGATLVFPIQQRWDSVQDFLRVLDETKATMTGMPSTWWQEWVSTMVAARAFVPKSLRTLTIGMERVDPVTLQRWKRLVGDRVTLRNAYGPTETTGVATMYTAGSSPWECASYVPIGRPLANVQVYVLNSEMRPVPVGVIGELYVGGHGVARGYLHNPGLTAERFVRNPFSDGRLYKTGDLVFTLPDGNLVFAGRLDRQVKIRGHRIELEEVEGVLGWHPAVVHAAVIVEGENGSERLRAFVVCVEAGLGGPPELRLHMSRHLPTHMIPSTFTVLREMPRTASGKIDRQGLLKIPRERIDLAAAAPSPRTEIERRIAELWVEVLGIEMLGGAQIGVSDNFFELGGNSLGATRLIAAIEQEFGRELSIGELSRVPTIAGMARALEQEGNDAGKDSVVVYRGRGTLPPLICVSSTANDVWTFRHVARHLTEERPVFIMPNPIRPGETLQDARELGARIRESIHTLRPHGPYILAGYCLGGVAVFEAAQLLVASGETVTLVALFDTPAPGYPKVLGSWKGYLRQFRMWVSSPKSIRLHEVAEHAEAVGQLIAQSAKAQYSPQPLNAPIAAFIAEDDRVSTRILEDPRLGWRDLTTQSFHIERVRGAHSTVLGETHAAELAGKLSGLIELSYRRALLYKPAMA